MGLFNKVSRALAGVGHKGPSGPAHARAYAVGDIHGRLDLLDALLGQIEADAAARPARKTYLIFLGDLIDRGPESSGVVERLRTLSLPGIRPIFLAGNHEEVMLRVLGGDGKVLQDWLKYGGAECLESYGVDTDRLRRMEEADAAAEVSRAVPRAHVEFLEGFGDTFRFGDYLFVHAGIRPGVAVEEQDRADLRWIREPFLSDAKEHGVVVVHGHTIVPKVDERHNRIGIDTGAYHSGVLTALAVEERERWYLSTGANPAGDTIRPTMTDGGMR
jgi:serine/threonine protein phosphatase 1